MALGAGTFQYLRGVPQTHVTVGVQASRVLGDKATVTMPANGASIVAVDGLGTLATAGNTTAKPIASVTKMMTAYVILKSHPLSPGEQGPMLTITARDNARYFQIIANDESALPVYAGLGLTRYQLLQGALIASANNFAEILAAWDAGSVTAFVTKMNAEAKALGMNDTVYVDASGISAGSASTPADQLILARAAMTNPVFREIVGTKTTTLPGIGPISNVNELLGQDGIVGIKTGFTEAAGGNLAFAADRIVNGKPVEIIGAVFGQATRPIALAETRRLVTTLGQTLKAARVMSTGQVVATVDADWSDPIEVYADGDADVVFWPGMTLEMTVSLDPPEAPMAAGDQVGTLTVRLGEQEHVLPLKLTRDLKSPSMLWRLFHL